MGLLSSDKWRYTLYTTLILVALFNPFAFKPSYQCSTETATSAISDFCINGYSLWINAEASHC